MTAPLNTTTIPIHWNPSQRDWMIQALVHQPFIEVFELLGKIHEGSDSQALECTRSELKICLKALRGKTGAHYWDLLKSIEEVLQAHGILGDRRV